LEVSEFSKVLLDCKSTFYGSCRTKVEWRLRGTWDVLKIGEGQQQAPRQTRGHRILEGDENCSRETGVL